MPSLKKLEGKSGKWKLLEFATVFQLTILLFQSQKITELLPSHSNFSVGQLFEAFQFTKFPVGGAIALIARLAHPA